MGTGELGGQGRPRVGDPSRTQSERVRVYSDTPTPAEPTPQGYADRVKGRMEMGFTFIKFDVTPRVLVGLEGMMIGSPTK